MKPFLLGLTLICSASPLWAQQPIGSRAFTGAEMKRSVWPKFKRLPGDDFAGDFVALQYLLRNQGFYKGATDGHFASQGSHSTESAVKALQRARGLKVDGIVGAQTWAKLLVRLKWGDRGDAVRALQTLLNTSANEEVEGVKVDGVFGATTERILRDVQKNNNLVADGVAGPQTWSALLVPALDD